MSDKALNATLAAIAGRGPLHYSFIADEYKHHGGNPKRLAAALLEYTTRWPERFIITEPYNRSASPVITVLPKDG